MKKIKGVIFDLDGTIANTLPLCISAFRKSIEPLLNRSVTDEEIISTFGPSEEGTIMSLAPAYYEEGVSAYLSNYQNLHDMCPSVFTGMHDLLSYLKARLIKIAMVTGKGKHSTDISLNYFNIKDFFEIVETGSPQGPRKAEGIQTVLDKWPYLQKNEVVYVGDAVSDIIASRKVGIPVIAAAWAETAEPLKLQQNLPDKIFYSVEDFANWIYEMV